MRQKIWLWIWRRKIYNDLDDEQESKNDGDHNEFENDYDNDYDDGRERKYDDQDLST